MRVLVVGYNTGVLTALSESPERHDVWVLEEPDLWRNKKLEAKSTTQACLRGVVLAEYQQSTAYRALVPDLPEVDAVAPCLEYAVPAAADIANLLGLPGAGVAAAEVLRDKLRLRRTTSRAGMPGPDFREVASAAETAVFVADGPSVLKPAQRQASLGVTFLEPGDDVDSAWAATTGADEGYQLAEREMSWSYLVERRLVGPEYSTEALVSGGDVVFLNTTLKQTYPGPAPVETGHSTPHHTDDPRWRTAVADLVRATGFGTGILHAEWIDTADGLALVECAGRPPGDMILDLVDRAWGLSVTDAWLEVLAGRRPALPAAPAGAAAIRYLVGPPGTVTAVTGVDDARACDGVWKVDVTRGPGDVIAPLRSSWDRAGYVAATGPDPDQAMGRAAEAASRISFTVKD